MDSTRMIAKMRQIEQAVPPELEQLVILQKKRNAAQRHSHQLLRSTRWKTKARLLVDPVSARYQRSIGSRNGRQF